MHCASRPLQQVTPSISSAAQPSSALRYGTNHIVGVDIEVPTAEAPACSSPTQDGVNALGGEIPEDCVSEVNAPTGASGGAVRRKRSWRRSDEASIAICRGSSLQEAERGDFGEQSTVRKRRKLNTSEKGRGLFRFWRRKELGELTSIRLQGPPSHGAAPTKGRVCGYGQESRGNERQRTFADRSDVGCPEAWLLSKASACPVEVDVVLFLPSLPEAALDPV